MKNLFYGKIGAFFTNDNGELQCGGWQTWTNYNNKYCCSWADDSTTDEKDGFDSQAKKLLGYRQMMMD